MKPCISQATTMPGTFADDLTAYAQAGWPAAEVWLTKLEKQLEVASVDATRDLIAASGVTLAAASYQGGLLLSQGEARKSHFDHFRRRLELCQAFGIPLVNVLADFHQVPDEPALGRSLVSLKQAAQWAAAFDVSLALEFRGQNAFCSCLDTAIDMVEQVAEPNLGICLDLFHFMKGPSKPDDLRRLRPEMLRWVQFCDVAGIPREVMADGDRIMPGEGDFPLMATAETLRSMGYEGYVSLELMNPVLWQMKPSQVAELGYQALAAMIGG